MNFEIGRLHQLTGLLVLLILVSGPLLFGAVETWATAPLVFLALAAGMLAHNIREVSVKAGVHPVELGLFLVVTYGCLQAVFPADPTIADSSSFGSRARFATLDMIPLWAAHFAILAASRRCSTRSEWLTALGWTLVILGAAIAFVGIAQQFYERFYGIRAIYGLRLVRSGRTPFGPFYNYNHAATLISVSIVVGLGLALEIWKKATHGGSDSKSDRWAQLTILFTLLSLAMFGLIQTGSRAGQLAFGAGTVALVLLRIYPRLKSKAAFFGAAAAATVSSILLIFLFHKSLIPPQEDPSFAYRLSIYRSGLQLFKDFPIFGSGLGTWHAIFPAYQEDMIKASVGMAHNDWLETFCDLGGLFGLILPLAVFSALVSDMLRKGEAAMTKGALRSSLTAAVVVVACHSLLDFPLQIPGLSLLFWILVGSTIPSPMLSGRIPAMPKMATTVLLLGCGLLHGVNSSASLLDWRASNAKPSSRESLRAYSLRLRDRPAVHYKAAKELAKRTNPNAAYSQPLLERSYAHAKRARDQAPHIKHYSRFFERISERVDIVK